MSVALTRPKRAPKPRLFIALWLLALAFPCRSFAFLRSYVNYEILSANDKFVAEVDYHSAAGPVVKVHELKDGARHFKWEAKLFMPIYETIHLSNDGEFIVLEDRYPYTDKVLHFFGKEGLIRVFTAREIVSDSKPGEGGISGSLSFMDPVGGRSKWDHRGRLALLSTAGSESCYCLWFADDKRWLAWRLKDALRLAPTPEQLAQWDREADRLAARVIEAQGAPPAPIGLQKPPQPPVGRTEGPPSASNAIPQPRTPSPRPDLPWARSGPRYQTPSLYVCYLFVTRAKTPENRKVLEGLLSDTNFICTGCGPNGTLLSVRGSSPKRSMGDRLLAEFEGKLKPEDGLTHWIEGGFYLGTVKGLIEFAKPLTAQDGVLWVYLIRQDEFADWTNHLRPERLPMDFAVMAADMKSVMDDPLYRLPAKVEFTFNEVPPAEYRIKLLWRKRATWREARTPSLPQPDDYENEVSPLVTVLPGLTVEPEPLRCDKLVTP